MNPTHESLECVSDSSPPHSSHRYGLLGIQSSLSKYQGKVPAYSGVVGFCSLQPADLLKQASHILLREPEVTSHSGYYKACPLSLLVCFVLGETAMGSCMACGDLPRWY